MTAIMGAPDDLGFFGEFGGRYVGEPLIEACREVELSLRQTPGTTPPGMQEFLDVLRDYAGRDPPLPPRLATTSVNNWASACCSSAKTSTTPAATRSTT